MKCIRMASGITFALLLGAGGGVAQADTTTTEAPVSLQSIRAQMGACHKEPTSYRGICKAQVNRRVDERYAALPAGSVAIAPGFVELASTAVSAELARDRALGAQCKRAPASERGSCADEASLGFARPEHVSSDLT
ncbi:MAG TPA: hypothetical protein VFS06_11855 [Casimicrobiaceae bacterium]|nr:hypothetical protein [Casimicrobiaceae bacterium]